MRGWLCRVGAVGIFVWFCGGVGSAADFSKQQLEFFEAKIRPLLVESCYECHQGHGAKSGLKLDSRAGVLRGTDYRKVVEPGAPEKSALLFAVKHAGKMGAVKVEKMPKKGERLSAQAVADLESWVKMGVPWPEEVASEEDPKNHWAFQPVKRAALPKVKTLNRAANGIDFFVLSGLEGKEMMLADEAGRRTLIRRLYFDLSGLPPTFEEVESFVSNQSPRAYEELVDGLLQSPRYGERWGRHWLDVARYSDTKGYRGGGSERRFIYSHTYRDWVIRAFNEDLPYDQFLLYQLAADYLTKDRKDKRDLAAMGFLTLGRRSTADDDIDDRLDVTFRGTMALTVSCSRCHDHKFDPIPTEDYYSLASVFINSEEPREAPVIGEPEDSAAYRSYLVNLAEKQKVVDAFLDPKVAELAKKFPNLANRRFQLITKLDRVDRRKLSNLQRVVDKFVADAGMEADRALILQDREKVSAGGRILIRGSRSRPGKAVPRHFLQLVAGENPPAFKNGSGRLEMAQAIVDVNNPLTARTMVNRVWQHHFGEGLVRTPSDFGLQGEKPSHPELLDWLSVWFVENGWSLKKLHRLILNSSTYKQGSVNARGSDYAAKDPENRLLWRMNRQRLEFEPMRDAALVAAGRLDDAMFGRSVKMTTQPFTQRRAMYAYVDRQNLDPVFGTFDFASPQKHTGQRPYTTIPTQTLFMLNSPFVMEQAAYLAKSVMEGSDKDQTAMVKNLYRKVLLREPAAEELAEGLRFLKGQQVLASARDNKQTSTVWQYGEGYYDGETRRVNYQPFATWAAKEKRWQPSVTMPDKKGMGYLHVFGGGGHPSNDPKHGAIVRWQAPDEMGAIVSGNLHRRSDQGDGVRLRVVHSRLGLIRELDIMGTENKAFELSDVQMKKGESLDFVVDCKQGSNSDSFTWKLDVRPGGGKKWSLADQFGGPGRIATPLENLAQALLCANEFMFVD